MSEMKHHDFSANGAHDDGLSADSLVVMATGTFGGGTLNIKRYSASREAFVTVASYTAATIEAEEIRMGRGATFQFELAGATTPAVTVDYWFV